MTEQQQCPTRKQIAEVLQLADIDSVAKTRILVHLPMPKKYLRMADAVVDLFSHPTQECGVCGRQYPADDPRGTCPVCWPGFGEHGQQPTPSVEAGMCPRCGGTGEAADDSRRHTGLPTVGRCDMCGGTGRTPATPPSIADMAPGTTFQWKRAREAWRIFQGAERDMLNGRPADDALDEQSEARATLDELFDQSTIRDVTPPPTTPGEGDDA